MRKGSGNKALFFVGTPVFSLPVCRPIYASGHSIASVSLAQQLACTVARQRLGAELHCTHTLVQRQGAVCLGDKVPHLLLFVLVAIDHHADLLAHFFYNTFLHGFALAHDAFQLFGADVLAAVQNDEVLLAAGQEIVAVLVLAGQIASVEPAVRVNDLGGGLRVLVVARMMLSPCMHSSPSSAIL